MAESSSSSDKDPTRAEVLKRFLFGAPENYFQPLDTIIPPDTDAAFFEITRALRRNLEAAVVVGNFPFTMVHTSVGDRLFQSILAAEAIRQLKSDSESSLAHASPEESKKIARKKASEEFHERMQSGETLTYVRDAVLGDLSHHLIDQQFKSAAAEILRQTLVMIWGAFEVFVTDTIIQVFNDEPKLAALLLKHDITKRHFPHRGIPIESLADYGFDVGRSMGSLLFGERQLDSLPLIRDILSVLAPKHAELQKLLGSTELWILWQRRHLIVHHRGIVDKAYLAKTPDKIAVGTQLELTSDYVESSLVLIRDVSVALIAAYRGGFLR